MCWYVLLCSQHHHVAVRYELLVSPPCALLFGSPGSPLNFVWQGWEKTQQLPLLFCTLFSPVPHILLHSHYFPVLSRFSTKESLSSLPVRGSARHTYAGKAAVFRILVGKRNGLMLKYPPCHVDTFLPPTWCMLSEQQGTPGSSAPAARSSAIRGARSSASPLTLAVFNHTSVGSNRLSQHGKGCTR